MCGWSQRNEYFQVYTIFLEVMKLSDGGYFVICHTYHFILWFPVDCFETNLRICELLFMALIILIIVFFVGWSETNL